MKKINLKKHKNACAVLALRYISQMDEETVLRVCSTAGFDVNDGMLEEDIIEAAADLGIKLEKIKYLRKIPLKYFRKKYPLGLFLVLTYDHALCIDNGLIYDPRERIKGRYPCDRRIVWSAYKAAEI